MKSRSTVKWFALAVALAFPTSVQLVAQQRSDAPATPSAVPAKAEPAGNPVAPDSSTQPPANQAQPLVANPGSGVAEVMRMVDAKVSNDVIRLYIETSPLAFFLTADNIIALRDRGVSDTLITAMLKRGAEIRAQASPETAVPAEQAGANTAPSAPAYTVVRPNYGVMDPNSYDYFYTYYLHPRTLASVYQRMGVYGSAYLNGYYPPFPAYPYGYGPHLGLSPLPRPGFQRSPQPWR
jgi:hypothetical protein